MIHFRKTICCLTVVFILFSFSSIYAFAEPVESKAEIFKNPYGVTMCASKKGNWKQYPENSLGAIKSAVECGADIVEINIKMTSDNVPVVISDDNVTRTCYGYGEKTLVSQLTYNEISALSLLQGKGGMTAEKTEEKVPSLEDVFKQNLDCLYMTEATWELRDDIYALAQKCGVLDKVIFFFGNVKTDDLSLWESGLTEKPMVMTYFKGNVIFAATSYLNNSVEAGAEGVFLATKVPYGVVFGDTVMDKANGRIRTMADTTDPSLCGKLREDTEVWWDDLISRGYSIILTDYVSELHLYIENCNEQREKLTNLYGRLVTSWTLPDFKSDKYLDYKHAYNNAATLSSSLINDKSSSRSQLSTALYELQKAYDDINSNYEMLKSIKAGLSITPIRIILCIAAIAAVVTTEIFFYKKKKKAQ